MSINFAGKISFWGTIFLLIGVSPIKATEMNQTLLSDSSEIFVQQIINSSIPILADFWASWCRPCHLLSPLIEEIKKEYQGKIKVLKINVDKNRKLANHFRVSSIPSIFLIKDKVVLKNILGVQPREVYISAINEILKTPQTDDEL